jgi:ribonuclease Z
MEYPSAKKVGGMRRHWKWLLAIVLIGLAATFLVHAFQARIATTMLAHMVEARIGHDSTAALPDGLHVALCGTGSPLPDPTRAGPCSVVIAGKHMFVVDIGEGGARKIMAMGLPIGRVEGLLLTHFHSDHVDGIGPLMLQRWIGRAATAPLPVHGPPGVEAVVAGFDAAYATDAGYRTAHHGVRIAPPSGAGGVAIPFALPQPNAPVVVLARDGVRIIAFRVDHGPVRPAVGYRFDYKGRSVVFSGDTAPSASLVAAAKGADLLVHEALQPRLVGLLTTALDRHGQPNTAQITRDILNYHTTPEQAADMAKAAGVKQLLLNHIVPPIPLRFAYPAFLRDAAQHFAGPIIVGEDGMLFSLPAGATTIMQSRLQ